MTVWTVTPVLAQPVKGLLSGPLVAAECALGKGGVKPEADKREGDGVTPLGVYPFRKVFYRPDRLETPITGLPVEPLSSQLGWCDDAESPHYNKLVSLPFGPSHEKLWREDHVYDLVVVIGHNDSPVVPGKGSAIFMHIAREDYTPTEGCVALKKADLLRFLRQVKVGDSLKITYP